MRKYVDMRRRLFSPCTWACGMCDMCVIGVQAGCACMARVVDRIDVAKSTEQSRVFTVLRVKDNTVVCAEMLRSS